MGGEIYVYNSLIYKKKKNDFLQKNLRNSFFLRNFATSKKSITN